MAASFTVLPPLTEAPYARLLRILSMVFVGAMAFSIAGSLLLRVYPASMALFGPYYATLVKLPTWTYMAILPVLPMLMFAPALGWKRMLAVAVAGSVIGGASELLGTTTGFPFGAYAYTMWLGPKILDHVPYFIPPSWFALSIACFVMASRITTHTGRRILIATVFMVLWDVSLDPAMSRAFPFWTYPGGGFFYGMPLSNWAGWFVVSLVIMCAYALLLRGKPLQHAWTPSYYALNCLFPLALSLVYGLYGAVAIGLVATAIPLAATYRDRSRTAVPVPS